MEVGIVIPTFDRFANAREFRRIVTQLEELGFASAWFGDHVAFPASRPEYMGDSWLDAVAAANAGLGMTSRLKFGTDVLVAPYRNPLLLAKMAATASVLSDNRFLLGLGIGWLEGEFEVLNTPPFAKRAQVTEEYLEVIRMAFEQSGELSYAGKWFAFERALFEPKPVGTLPILVGGNHEKALRRAAVMGDGWHPLFLTPPEYARCRSEIERIRQELGITRRFCFSMSGSQCRIMPGGGAAQLTKVAQEGTSYAPAVGADEAGRTSFIGTADQVRADCLALAAAGVDQLVLRFAVPLDQVTGPEEHFEQLRLFAEEVLPACQAA